DSVVPERISSDGGASRLGNSYFVLSCIACLALLIRLLPLLLQSRTDWMTANNSNVYLDLVQGLRHDCGFAAWTGGKCAAAETSRTPGYPLFLAIFPSAGGAIAAQAVLWSGLCFM